MIYPPPPPPPTLTAPRRSHLRLVLGGLAAALAGVIVLGALGFFITDDLGLRSKVHNVDGSLSSEKAAYGVDQQAISAMQTQITGLQSQVTGLQSQKASLQSQNASLQSQIPAQPDFVVVGTGWDSTCATDGCFPDATFTNNGQAGEAVAEFKVFPSGSTSGTPLAACSAAIPWTPANGSADAGCTAVGAALAEYSGNVTFTVTVTNP